MSGPGRRVAALLTLTLAFAGCADDGGDSLAGVTTDDLRAIVDAFGLAPLPDIPYPPDNPYVPARIVLGQLLFFDPILGGESSPALKSAHGRDPYRDRANDVACATCHLPSFGFADGRPLGAGVAGAQFHGMALGPARVVPGPSLVTGDPVGTEPRNAPTVLNTAFNGRNSIEPTFESFQFMDGRVTGGLEAQAILPITSRDEMAGDAYGTTDPAAIQEAVAARLRDIPEYVTLFGQAFPGEISGSHITVEKIGRAIAAFERELITPGSRYDAFVAGEWDALSAQEVDGFRLFFGRGKCGDCHSGPMLCDFTFRVQGVADAYDRVIPGFGGKSGDGHDFGRFHADPGAFADQKYAFRVLTVRNAELTAPYFHSGSAATLHDLVRFYNEGGRGPDGVSDAELAAAGAIRDPSITPLFLTEREIDAIVAFMRTTTAPVQPGPPGIDLMGTPTRVPSGLCPPGIPTPDGPGPFMMRRG
ncbi:hypothetical protein K8I85_16715 [bacterium]|nr:hypothetical protein [bacterium]